MLRLLEHYTSPQGEGPRVGIMSQFVRFAGCNLRCPGWPCDSQFAIQPQLFSHEQKLVDPVRVVDLICVEASKAGAKNIVFTGGEPLLQTQDGLATIVGYLKEDEYKFEIFTNGTLSILDYLAENCSFVMDWKLPGSGEGEYNGQRIDNLDVLDNSKNAVKFTIATQRDLFTAQALYGEHLKSRQLQVFVGAAWDQYSNETIVDFVKHHQLPWRLNVQVHNYVFGPQRRLT